MSKPQSISNARKLLFSTLEVHTNILIAKNKELDTALELYREACLDDPSIYGILLVDDFNSRSKQLENIYKGYINLQVMVSQLREQLVFTTLQASEQTVDDLVDKLSEV